MASNDGANQMQDPFDGLPMPGSTLGAYVIERRLGQGGMAAVLAARHRALGKRVAIKMMLPESAARPDLARRFVREGEAVARLNHPHVVDVTDVGTSERGQPYLVMEYLEGEDLAAYLKRHGPLSVAETADMLVPVISAIAAAHDVGIVHRDLKPQNLFLAQERDSVVPTVLDFGISKLMGSAESLALTSSGMILGTPDYLSPEQAHGAELDERTDQFSLGIILYECVSGRRPFHGDSLYMVIANIVSKQPVPLRELAPGVPARFEALVSRALQKEPDKRFTSVRELGRELVQLASYRTRLTFGPEFGLPGELSHISDPSAPPARVRAPWPLALGLGAVLALGLLLTLTLWSDGAPLRREPRRITPEVAALPQPVALVQRAATAPVTSPPATPSRYEVSLTVVPPTAQLSLDGETVSNGALALTLPVDGREHTLVASCAGYRAATLTFRDAPPTQTQLVLERMAMPLTKTAQAVKKKPAPSGPVRTPTAAVEIAAPEPRPATPSPQPASSPAPAARHYGTNNAVIVR